MFQFDSSREKAHQRARTLGKLEAVEQLVAGPRAERPPTRWRRCVLASSSSDRSSTAKLPDEGRGDALVDPRRRDLRDLHADETCARGALVADAVVELGDRDGPGRRSGRSAGSCRAPRDRHGEHRLARLADLGAFGHEAQAVEVHVGAAGDGDEGRGAACALRRVLLRPRHAPAPAGSRMLRVSWNTSCDAAQTASVSTGSRIVDHCRQQAEGFAARLDRRAVGEQADLQGDAASGLSRTRHGIGVDRPARRSRGSRDAALLT